jgi:uncharacterized protein YggU (UPF0235/DUF167 family)
VAEDIRSPRVGAVSFVRVTIRVKPGASRTRVGGRLAGSLVVAVTAPAVDGRATEAALRALADAVGVRRGDVALVTGAASRTKVVDIADHAGTVAARVDALLLS